MADCILKYFPDLSETKINQFNQMIDLYPKWNEKINVISRKDISNLEINHLLHSLAIAKYINFTDGSTIMDFGCGGGLPGLPLAVIFPNCHFHLVDRTGKKLLVAEDISKKCGLDNVSFFHGDVKEVKSKFDFVVSRAVMPQEDLIKICTKNISQTNKNAIPNGLITLKGGDLNEEMKNVKFKSEICNLSDWFDEPFFETKKLIFSPI